MNPIFKRIFFAFIPAILVFGIAEIFLRVQQWPKATEDFEHNEAFWLVDPDLRQYSMPHNEESTSFVVSTNSDGLRTPYEQDNPQGQFRIMTLGCSTTFGWGVGDMDTYPAKLEKYLQEKGFTNVQVVNGGQPGYTSFQGNWLWDQLLYAYKPDLVIIGYIVQDARKAAYSDKSQAILQADNRFLKDHFLYRSKTYLAVRYVMGGIQIQAKERNGQDEGGSYRVPPEDYVENIRQLVAKVSTNGGKSILFGYPLERTGYTEQHRQIVRYAAEELHTGYFDPQANMEKATMDTQLYFPRDKGHANVAGNDLIAVWMMEYLINEQWIPQP